MHNSGDDIMTERSLRTKIVVPLTSRRNQKARRPAAEHTQRNLSPPPSPPKDIRPRCDGRCAEHLRPSGGIRTHIKEALSLISLGQESGGQRQERQNRTLYRPLKPWQTRLLEIRRRVICHKVPHQCRQTSRRSDGFRGPLQQTTRSPKLDY